MRREMRIACIAAVAVALAGCDLQVQDQTPAQFQANPDVGMYPIKVKVTRGAMVSPQIYVFAITGDHRVALSPAADDTWQTMLAVSCKSSFPLQYLAVWRLQGVATRQELFPAQPRQVELTPPPLTKQAAIDTSGQPGKKTRTWEGAVQYEFVTAPDVHITGAHLEPTSQDRADIEAAKPISIASTFPIDASCGTPTAVELASRDRRAHANLVIDTDLAGITQWTTRVDFAPQQ